MKKALEINIPLIFAKVIGLFFFGLMLPPGVSAQAPPLSTAKTLLLERQYWQVIQQCGEVIKEYPEHTDILSEANYFIAVAYVNLFDFLTAKYNFQSVVNKYKGSKYYEDSYVGLGEVEFLQENNEEAVNIYEEFLSTAPSKKKLATVYFRLAELYLKRGNQAQYKKYLDKLKAEFPLSFESRDAVRLTHQEAVYTVQVGAFVNYANAEKFIEELKRRGYDVYSVLCMLEGKKLCRIRVGKYKTIQEAQGLKKRLEADGYFAKIFP